jgi:hypothetical protein
MTIYEQHYSVYGDAELWKGGCRMWPKQALLRSDHRPEWRQGVPDAWLILEGIQAVGICVVGLVKVSRTLTYRNVCWDPAAEPDGRWQQISHARGKARWAKVRRTIAWERLLLGLLVKGP